MSQHTATMPGMAAQELWDALGRARTEQTPCALSRVEDALFRHYLPMAWQMARAHAPGWLHKSCGIAHGSTGTPGRPSPTSWTGMTSSPPRPGAAPPHPGHPRPVGHPPGPRPDPEPVPPSSGLRRDTAAPRGPPTEAAMHPPDGSFARQAPLGMLAEFRADAP